MPDPAPAPAAPAGQQQPQQPSRADPLRAYNFTLEIDNNAQGYFIQCSGLGAKVTPIRYREGGGGRTVRMLAGPVEYGEITLRYGLTESPVLWEWFKSAIEGKPQRKNVSLIMQGPEGTGERMRWNLLEAWPCAFRGAELDALGREIAIESLTLCCETIERA
ncbi:MAG TPA: phage tail protein [Anaeromyxobacter sp.]|nr:phage tail protein [Anaeromyxobacter sp.]